MADQFNDTGKRNRWRSNVSAGLKHSAALRRCPQCKRKGALRTQVDGEFVLTYCRYGDCDYERGRYV